MASARVVLAGLLLLTGACSSEQAPTPTAAPVTSPPAVLVRQVPYRCSLITKEQAEELVPIAMPKPDGGDQEGCRWRDATGSDLPEGQRYELTVNAERVQDVKTAFARVSAYALREQLRGLGDEAVLYEWDDGVGVVFRAGDVMATVSYTSGAAPDQRMRDNAVKAARWVMASLTTAPPPPDPRKGRFQQTPRACSLMSPGDYLEKSVARCEDMGRRLLLHYAPAWAGRSGPAVAKELFGLLKRQGAAYAEVEKDVKVSPVRKVEGLGEEAFAQDQRGAVVDTTLWIRVSNLVIEISQDERETTSIYAFAGQVLAALPPE